MPNKLSSEEISAISFLLGSDNSALVVETIVKLYAKQSVENARSMLGLIQGLSDIALKQINSKAIEYKEAAFWLINQRAIADEAQATCFASMVPVCKAMFPDGYPTNGSKAETLYFEKFLSLFRNKKAFSWDRDKGWADTYGYTDYLMLIDEQTRE